LPDPPPALAIKAALPGHWGPVPKLPPKATNFVEILQVSFAITGQLAVCTGYPVGAALGKAGPFVFAGNL
jgi:hypothetical protein